MKLCRSILLLDQKQTKRKNFQSIFLNVNHVIESYQLSFRRQLIIPVSSETLVYIYRKKPIKMMNIILRNPYIYIQNRYDKNALLIILKIKMTSTS